jgi:hypothetical protein
MAKPTKILGLAGAEATGAAAGAAAGSSFLPHAVKPKAATINVNVKTLFFISISW